MSETSMVNIQIDGLALEVTAGTTVLKAAELMGIVIPRFCYHPAFAPEGSCRMCLVKIEGLPKLDLACSTVVRDGMKVWTSTPEVLQARKDVLEFFLADHPLDCPICDKAGECFLQDYYDRHGRYESHFLETKEKKEKEVPIGKRLLLDRERCVLCTRCVRFLRLVTGTGELGVFERSVKAEIGILNGIDIKNNYSGNLVDICPVGAITDGDFRFKTRVWSMERGKTVCPRCSRGCAMVIEFVSGYPIPGNKQKIYRIKAAENALVNGFWICDYGRYGYHDFEDNRHDRITLKDGQPAAGDVKDVWETVLSEAAGRILALTETGRSSRISLIMNSFLTNAELGLCRKIFVESLGIRNIYWADPGPGAADGFLLTEDRAPNGRGVIDCGFKPRLPDLGELSRSSEALIVFGSFLKDLFPVERIASSWERIGFKLLLTAHNGPLDALADMALPTALSVEKTGAFTNKDGVVQAFCPVFPAPGWSFPEGEILKRLGAKLGARVD